MNYEEWNEIIIYKKNKDASEEGKSEGGEKVERKEEKEKGRNHLFRLWDGRHDCLYRVCAYFPR